MHATHKTAPLLALAALGLAAQLTLAPAARAQGYTFTTFDQPNAAGGPFGGTAAGGINNSGLIVGAYGYDAAGDYAGFAVTAAGLGSPDSFISYSIGGGGATEFDAVNDSGQIAGDYFRSGSDGANPGFLLNGLGHTDFLPPGQVYAFPFGLNNGGTASGSVSDEDSVSQGFVRAASGAVTLFSDPNANANGTFGYGNNDAGTTVGYYFDKTSGNVMSFLRSAAGTFTEFSIPSAVSTNALDINNAGAVVGDYRGATGGIQGFLRTAGGTVITLDVPGATNTRINGVNDRGQIVGNYDDASGGFHAFFATPNAAPEPSPAVALVLGVLSVAGAAIRARIRPFLSGREPARPSHDSRTSATH